MRLVIAFTLVAFVLFGSWYARAQEGAENLVACGGDGKGYTIDSLIDFMVNMEPKWELHSKVWSGDELARMWTKLPPAPAGLQQSTVEAYVFYEPSTNRAIVAFVDAEGCHRQRLGPVPMSLVFGMLEIALEQES